MQNYDDFPDQQLFDELETRFGDHTKVAKLLQYASSRGYRYARNVARRLNPRTRLLAIQLLRESDAESPDADAAA